MADIALQQLQIMSTGLGANGATVPADAPTPDDNAMDLDGPPDSTYDSSRSDTSSGIPMGFDDASETESFSSLISPGSMEHGRLYPSLRDGYWGPCDEKQFKSMYVSHLKYSLLDFDEDNFLFRSPVGDNPKTILDAGCGFGQFTVDVADKYPQADVIGVDICPPRDGMVPRNIQFEVDDLLKPWFWEPNQFDLIHARHLLGFASRGGWTGFYKQSYEHLVPGGWFEAVEPSISFYSDDGTLPADSALAKWGPMFQKIGEKAEKPLDMFDTMKSMIIQTGFINVHQRDYKIPLLTWPRAPKLKEVGRLLYMEIREGMEGYALRLLTSHGEPKPWTVEEVMSYLNEVRMEMHKGYHVYVRARRIWCQKPLAPRRVFHEDEGVVDTEVSPTINPTPPFA